MTGFSARERRDRALKAAQDIVATAEAEKRDLTPDETVEVKSHTTEVENLNAFIKSAADSQAALKAIGAEPDDSPGATGTALALTGPAAKHAATYIANTALGNASGFGQKAVLGVGAIATEVPLATTPLAIGKTATSILQTIPVVRRSTPTYRYLRQTVRTNNAAIVAPGGTKPTSVYTVDDIDGKLEVFAHLSEPVDKYLLADASELGRFIATEMLYGLNAAVEQEVLNGAGTAGHLTGILATSGIQTQAALTDSVTTLRAAITKLEVAGYTASVFVLNPTDWEAIETTRNTSGAFDLNGPVDRAAQKVWGVPVVLSSRIAAGTALAFDTSTVQISTDTQGIETKWSDQHGTLFGTNQLIARVEGRFGLDVLIPTGTVKITLPEDEV